MVVQPGQDWDRDNDAGALNCPTHAGCRAAEKRHELPPPCVEHGTSFPESVSRAFSLPQDDWASPYGQT